MSMRRTARGLACASLLCLSMMSAPAFGQQTDIAEVLEQAQQHYDAGQFREAAPLLIQAYDELEAPVILYRLGNVYNSLGNFRRAREYYQKFLAKDPETDLRGRVEAKIETLKRLEEASQSWLVIHLEPPGEVFQANAPNHAIGATSEKIPVGAGPHRVVVASANDHRLELEVDVGAAKTVERWVSFDANGIGHVSFEAPAPTEEPRVRAEDPDEDPADDRSEAEGAEDGVASTSSDSDEEVAIETRDSDGESQTETPRPRTWLWVGITTGVAGVGLLGFGAYNDLVVIPNALREQQEIIDDGRAANDSTDAIDDALEPARRKRQAAATSAIVGYSVGGVLLLTGIALSIVDMRFETAEQATTWYPVVTPESVGFGLKF